MKNWAHDGAVTEVVSTDGSIVPLKGVEVRGELVGRVSAMRMIQFFRNDEGRPLEVIYKFPLPESAAVTGLKAIIGDRVIEGRVEGRDEAFRQYDEALSAGDGALLLDEERPNVFTLSLGSLLPGTEARVEVSFMELLDSQSGQVRLTIPATISPRHVPEGYDEGGDLPVSDLIHPPYSSDPGYGLKLFVDVRGRSGIASVESPSHPVRTAFSGDSIHVEFASDTVAMDRDFILSVSYAEGFKARAYSTDDDDFTYLQIDCANPLNDRLAPKSGIPDTSPDSETIFVVDCSGSMEGSSIAQAKRALDIMLKAISRGRRFNVYAFGSSFTKAFDRARPCDDGSLAEGLAFAAGLSANLGGTELLAPIMDILAVRGEGDAKSEDSFPKDIVLLTDGEIGNEDQIFGAAGNSGTGCRMFTAGIGHGPNEFLIRDLARRTGGACEFIAPGERVEPKVLRLFSKACSESTRRVRIDSPSGGEIAPAERVMYPGEASTVFVRMPRGACEKVELALCPVNGRGHPSKSTDPFEGERFVLPVCLVEGESSGIARGWARERIRDLESRVEVSRGSRQTARVKLTSAEATVELAKKYGLACRKASFVAIEPRAPGEKPREVSVLRKVLCMITEGWHGGPSAHRPAAAPSSAFGFMTNLGYEKRDIKKNVRYCLPAFKPPSIATAAPSNIAAPGGGVADVIYSSNRQFSQSDSLSNPVFAPRDESKDELLYRILYRQRLDRGFEFDPRIATAMGLNPDIITNAANSLILSIPTESGASDGDSTGSFNDSLLLVWSAVAMAFMNRRMAPRRDEWSGLVAKTERWLAKICSRNSPTIGDMGLADWARSVVAG